MIAESLIVHLSETELLRIVQFLPYRDILRLLSTCKAFQQYRHNHQLSTLLLQHHFNASPAKTSLTYQQYYQKVHEYLTALQYKYTLTNSNKLKLEARSSIFTDIRNVKQLYKDAVNLDDDIEFLVVKAASNHVKGQLFLGGACFYYTHSIFHVRKQQDVMEVHGLQLQPYLHLANYIVFADVNNSIGLGAKQRYFVVDVNGSSIRLVNIREEVVLKRGDINRIDQTVKEYCDYYGTDGTTLLSDCTTRGIRVRAVARPSYDDQRSSWDEIVFTYQIRISDAGASEKGARLLTREWLIEQFDEHGNRTVQQVKGDGVIGKFPTIKRGCKDFKYESCSIVSKKYGQMSGAFNFQDLATGEQFRVQVRPFKLDMSPDRRVEYNLQTRTARVIE